MPMGAGAKVGPYEITAAIGAGGMGEVYRATDTRLKREVAIKVLPAAFTEDKERLARFEREAQLLAQLNHSNIAHVYGFESATLDDLIAEDPNPERSRGSTLSFIGSPRSSASSRRRALRDRRFALPLSDHGQARRKPWRRLASTASCTAT